VEAPQSRSVTTADKIRHVADVVEQSAIGRRKEIAIELICLHIVRACGSGENAAEARLLLELLEG
jgi:hypothetical protein